MLLFWWAGSLAAKLLADSLVYRRLEDDASALLSALVFPDLELDAPRLTELQLNPAYETPYSGKYFTINLASGGGLPSRSMWEQGIDLPLLAPGEVTRTTTIGIAGETLLVWGGGFSKEGHEFTIVVAEDLTPIADRMAAFKWFFAVMAIFLLVSLMVVQHLIVRWSVKKLERVRADIRQLEHGRVEALSEDVPAEVLPLVTEFNRLLRLFDQRLKHSRNSVGNLAHSLKGPLNLLLRASNEESSQPEELRRRQVRDNTEQIRQLIERELKRARLAGRGTAGRLFQVQDELPALTGLLKQVYSDKKITVDYHIEPGVELVFDRQDMLELIGNLLDNAVKWGHSRVRFSLQREDAVRFTVEDDGPGCSAEELHRLTGRGVRLDESVSGHGLGLSIVKDIVDTYGGSIEFGSSPHLGGFRATVLLPVPEDIGETGTDAERKVAGRAAKT